jgi:hypothetical protein
VEVPPVVDPDDEKATLSWWCTVLLRIIPGAATFDEALDAANLAVQVQPYPPDDVALSAAPPAADPCHAALYDRPGGEALRILDAELARMNRELAPRLEKLLREQKGCPQ